ncbi:MAG TPA: hypothetical protein VEF89_18530 [Solirubrobacteraceae bacterium]|nr:hypothetical protein [Solirubrobacteraceae bacterium]
MVLRSLALFAIVNAGWRRRCRAAGALAAADPEWLWAMITRRVPLTNLGDALDRKSRA